jgi:cytidylate kinase
MLAEKLNYLFLDTGCMYRAVTLAALEQPVDSGDAEALASLTAQLDMTILPAAGEADGRLYTVLLGGRDVTWAIRSTAVDANVSWVSAVPEVRRLLVEKQRALAERGGVVMVGRDIGTVVLPDAPLKLYVIASPAERAKRRWLERQERGESADYEAILADVIRRDEIDSSREHSPMRPAEDAIIIDSTGRLPEEILAEILTLQNFSVAVVGA